MALFPVVIVTSFWLCRAVMFMFTQVDSHGLSRWIRAATGGHSTPVFLSKGSRSLWRRCPRRQLHNQWSVPTTNLQLFPSMDRYVTSLWDMAVCRFSLWDVYRYQPLSHSNCGLKSNVWQLCHVWLDRVRKYKRCSFFVRQNISNEYCVRLKAHTLFIGRVLYFLTSHSNEHRLYILLRLGGLTAMFKSSRL